VVSPSAIVLLDKVGAAFGVGFSEEGRGDGKAIEEGICWDFSASKLGEAGGDVRVPPS